MLHILSAKYLQLKFEGKKRHRKNVFDLFLYIIQAQRVVEGVFQMSHLACSHTTTQRDSFIWPWI